MKFFPDNFEISSNSADNFFKPVDGENRIRILTAATCGYEDWIEKTIQKQGEEPKKVKSAVRFTLNNKPKPFDPSVKVKSFSAFAVYDVIADAIKVFQVTQVSINKALQDLVLNSDWGMPYFYDIKIVRSGKALLTKYDVTPCPKKELAQSVIDRYNKRPACLDALFRNEDPFEANHDVYAKLAIDSSSESTYSASAPKNVDLDIMLEQCDPVYRAQLKLTMSKLVPPCSLISQMPDSMISNIRALIIKKHAEYNSK